MDAPVPNPSASVAPRGGIVVRWLQRRRARREASRDFDSRWVGRALLLPVIASQFVWFPVANAVSAALLLATALCGALICAYYAHLLLARLQCSLLEFLVLIAGLGSWLGMLLASPALYALGTHWVVILTLLGGGWVLHGAVLGVAQARLLGVESPAARACHILLGWITSGSRGVLLLGLSLSLIRLADRRSFAEMLGQRLATWGTALFIAGIAGILLSFVVNFKTRRAAQKILGETVPQSRAISAA